MARNRGSEDEPIVDGWQRPRKTFLKNLTYLRGWSTKQQLAIIDYWIGKLFLERSSIEAKNLPPEPPKKS